MAVAGVVGVVAVGGALGDTPKNTEVVPPPHDLRESRGTLNQHHYPAHPRGSVLESLIALHLEEDEGVDIAEATPPTSITGTPRIPPDPDTGVDILKEVRPALQTILRNLQGGSDDLGAPEGTKLTQGPGSPEASLVGGQRPSMLGVLDGFGLNSWGYFRDVAQGYLSLLQQEYEAQDSETQLPLNLLRSLLQAGDQVNLLKSFGEKLNPDLLGFLQGGIGPLLSPVVEAGRAAGVTPAVGDAVTRVARTALHHFIDHVLWVTRKDVTAKDLQDFRDDLKLRIPLVAEGLDILLARNITEGPRAYGGYPLGGVSYGEYGSPDGYGAYGGHAGYGGGSYGYGGHGYGLYLDPYLVLASIGAAALLAYLGFKVILAKTTAMRRLRRDDQLDESDLPRGLVDTPEYDLKGSLRFTEELDDLAGALNGLWVERQRHDDPACVSCWMTTFAARHDSARPPLVPIVVSLLAHLLGAPRSGQLMDQATLQVLEGRPVTCPRVPDTCDLP
ncbi:uncharacterized protein LOC123509456 [Portunus trituberculatus]|uniref:uncharacterized protein LOC123509456 n=1 Tax=Portunus trituberculatus TaxID=210409 RepID=UPI001E1CF018|nr:uncharacterized protein LOC123509456 [Portunus trituberculatus]